MNSRPFESAKPLKCMKEGTVYPLETILLPASASQHNG
jgi:hypothetical protein